LLLAALAMLPMPRNAATIAAAEILLIALKRTGIVIGSSFPFQSHGSALHSRSVDLLCKLRRANALLNVADFSIREGHLHILVIVDDLHSQLGHPHRFAKGSYPLIFGLADAPCQGFVQLLSG
jgi:hypothetical protein